MSVRATVCKSCPTSLLVVFSEKTPAADVEHFFHTSHQAEPHTPIRELDSTEFALYEQLKKSLRKEVVTEIT